MDRLRYEGYVAARDAIAAERLEPVATEVLDDLAEALLLARDPLEADAACAAVPEAIGELVDTRVVTRRAADRVWVHLKACGPDMSWPQSWDRSPAIRPRGAVPEF